MIKINRLDIFNNDNPLCIKKNLCVIKLFDPLLLSFNKRFY